MKEEIKEELIKGVAEDIVNSILVGMEEEKERFKFVNAYVNFILELKENNIDVDYKQLEDKFIIEIHNEIIDYIGDYKNEK